MLEKPAAKRAAPKKTASKNVAPRKAVTPKAAKKSAAPGSEVDPRFVPVLKAFARTPGFSIMEAKSGAMRGLMLNGRSFGMSSHGRFMLKLDEAHVAELIADGTGKAFSPAEGRVMKAWIEITHPKADWVALAKLAHRLASKEASAAAKKSKSR